MRKTIILTSLVGTMLVSLAGCVVTARPAPTVAVRAVVPGPPVHVRVAPPRHRVEVIPVRPSPSMVWIRGRYRWDGRRYTWVPGSYVRRPRPQARWVDGRWRRDPRGWYWVPGRWR
jgi:hypothetical protein